MPKGIGDDWIRLDWIGFGFCGPQRPSCISLPSSVFVFHFLASTAFMPKGIGDPVASKKCTVRTLGLNGLHAERHW